MKLLILFLFLFPLAVKAQDSTILRSDYENFILQPGKLFRAYDSAVGKVNNLWVYTSMANNLYDGIMVKAITIKVFPTSTSTSLTIDSAEGDEVIKAISYFMTLATPGPDEDPIYTYLTKHDVLVKLSYTNKWTISLMKIHHQRIDWPVKNTEMSFPVKQFESLPQVMRRALPY